MDEVDRLLEEAERAPFHGWDFSYLAGRWHDPEPPWNYAALVRAASVGATSLLDLGTGGGELLASLADALPPDAHATEAYPPNVAIARRRLDPLGVRVAAIDPADLYPVPGQDAAHRLPYPDARFDLVLARHEAYDPAEVARALRPGGTFVTQQVGGRHFGELNRALGAAPPTLPDWCLATAVRQVEAAGLRVRDAREAVGEGSFADVGAIVYYLTAVPWQIPDFTVARYGAALRRLHPRMPLRVTSRPFLLAAVHA